LALYSPSTYPDLKESRLPFFWCGIVEFPPFTIKKIEAHSLPLRRMVGPLEPASTWGFLAGGLVRGGSLPPFPWVTGFELTAFRPVFPMKLDKEMVPLPEGRCFSTVFTEVGKKFPLRKWFCAPSPPLLDLQIEFLFLRAII